MENNLEECLQRNIHKRTEEELKALLAAWEECPESELRLDINPLLEWSVIPDIPMEDISNDELDADDDKSSSLVLSEAGEEQACEQKADDSGDEADGKEEEEVS